MRSRVNQWPIPTNLILRTLPPAIIAMTALAAGHAGQENWIQGSNYLVAALPLALSTAALWHARRTGNRSARLYGAVYLATFWAFVVYSWQSTERHKHTVSKHEAALAPTIKALADYQALHAEFPSTLASLPPLPNIDHLQYAVSGAHRESYRLGFQHNLLRFHVYEPGTGWQDEARQ